MLILNIMKSRGPGEVNIDNNDKGGMEQKLILMSLNPSAISKKSLLRLTEDVSQLKTQWDSLTLLPSLINNLSDGLTT